MSNRLALPAPDVASATTQALPHTKVLEQASSMDITMFGLFLEADLVVKTVIMLLILASIWSWAIIIEKHLLHARLRRKMDQFENNFWANLKLDEFYDKWKHTAKDPISRAFVAGMYEWRRTTLEDISNTQFSLESHKVKGLNAILSRSRDVKDALKERLYSGMELSRNREIRQLEKHLSFLATTGSVSPFIGLFGTVWGIMNSFTAIAATQNATLAVVAPGIAEALFATAIGLFAAIPAVIFYNKFSNKSADVSERVDAFTDEFIAELSRMMDR